MAEAWRIAEPLGLPEPYEVIEIERRTAPALFLAAGSGLAPVRVLLEAALAAGCRRSPSLIFSDDEALNHE